MLETVAVAVIILCLLGLVSSYNVGGFIHFSSVVAIVVIALQGSLSGVSSRKSQPGDLRGAGTVHARMTLGLRGQA